MLPVTAAESLHPDCGLHRRWTLCAPGHMMGLDVHDCASAQGGPLPGRPRWRPARVLTVEPGLYFQANDETIPPELRGLGIRIEDDVLITPGGYELLSSALPREPDEIEAWIADHGRIL